MADNKTKQPNADASDKANVPEGDEQPSYVTNEQLNRAITSKLKAFESAITGRLEEIISRVAPAQDSNPKPADEVTKRISNLEKQLEASKKEAEAAKAKNLDTTLRTRVSEELSKIGVASPKHAIALLVDAEKRIAWGDDERLVWRGDDGTESDLGSGLKAWAKSSDARLLLSPRGTAGSGDRGAPASLNGKTKTTPSKADVGRALLSMMSGGSFGSAEGE